MLPRFAQMFGLAHYEDYDESGNQKSLNETDKLLLGRTLEETRLR